MAANQRERLYAAAIAVVAEKGYEETTVGDLIEVSGVSRSAFYRHFADKKECCLAAVAALVAPTMKVIEQRGDAPLSEERARATFHTFLELLIDQAAAARVCFVEIHSAGPEASDVLLGAVAAFETAIAGTLDRMPGRAGMPREIVRATIGGLHKVIGTRLYRGEEDRLLGLEEQMWEWRLSYLPPPRPLRSPRRRPARPLSFEDRQAASTAPDRILRALADVVARKGYAETTIADIGERAAVSHRTFYEHFDSKEEALFAAIDQGSSLMLAASLPAFRRAPDWEHGVQAALGAMFAFGTVEPEYARLGTIGVWGAGRKALAQRDRIMTGMEVLLGPGREKGGRGLPRIAAEATGGAVYALVYDQVRNKGPEHLPELGPLASYVALCPFVGAERALEVACE